MSRDKRELQRLDGRRGQQSDHALRWSDMDAIMAEIAARSSSVGGRFARALGAAASGDLRKIDYENIFAPSLPAPANLAITSSPASVKGFALLYFHWDDVSEAVSYDLGIAYDGLSEFSVFAPRSGFQIEVIAGRAVDARVRSVNAMGAKGDWSAVVSHTAASNAIAPIIPDADGSMVATAQPYPGDNTDGTVPNGLLVDPADPETELVVLPEAAYRDTHNVSLSLSFSNGLEGGGGVVYIERRSRAAGGTWGAWEKLDPMDTGDLNGLIPTTGEKLFGAFACTVLDTRAVAENREYRAVLDCRYPVNLFRISLSAVQLRR